MKKNLDKYGEILYHLINFRLEQYKDSKSMIGLDFDSFMIISCIGRHYLRFKGTKYEQETFFVKDPNENILEIKTLTSNPD